MRYLPDGNQMKEADRYTIEELGVPSLVLMERAALQTVELMEKKGIDMSRVLVVCGSGNNGGDGFAVARILTEKGRRADILFVGKESSMSSECRRQKEIAEKMGLNILTEFPRACYSVVVDAVFGVGLSREIEGKYRDLIEIMNSAHGYKVAVVGSGPSGLACAADLAKMGYDVTIFEALHKAGGVLEYGIPEFRLPKEKIVAAEISKVRSLGVRIETDVVVGRTVTVDSLLDNEGFSAVFIGSGAGLPRFMNIPGENLNGVFSANEFLTRNNLMKAYRHDYRTPVYAGNKAVVVGGGNVVMDAARTALRLGADTTVVYRRTEKELPARREEVHHAKEEGIRFMMLSNPVEILGDEKGWVRGVRCIRMELGEPDESGRRSPVPVPGSEFEIEADSVIMALGTLPNPLIARTTSGLETNRRGCITADEDGATTRPGVFAGGDAVTGAATVILAMGAGRKAAAAIDRYIKSRNA